MKKFRILVLAGLTCRIFGEVEFKPINFDGYGLKEPSIELVVGSPESRAVLESGDIAVIVDFKVNDAIPPGVSLKIDGRVISKFAAIDETLAKSLLEELRNPLNYGVARPALDHSGKKIEIKSAVEITNGVQFLRFYFDDNFEYCKFYSQGRSSDVWTLSQSLSSLLKRAAKSESEK